MSHEDLDGVVAAPDHHRVIFENDAVRVLETTIPSGDATPLHTHLSPQVMYVVSGSHFVRRDGDGGTPIHTLENTGPDDLIVIGVEHKPLVAAG